MAVTALITAETAAEISGPFTTSGPATVTGDNFGGKKAVVLVEKVDGTFQPLTTKEGAVYLSDLPNTVFIPGAGTYKVEKPLTDKACSIGWFE